MSVYNVELSSITSTLNTGKGGGRMMEISHLDQEDSPINRLIVIFVFPLFAEMSFTVRIPGIFHILHGVLQLIQVFVSANFLGSVRILPEAGSSVKTLYAFVDVFIIRSTMEKNLAAFIILTILFFFYFFWCLYVYISFSWKRVFTKQQLYITHILCIFLFDISLPLYISAFTKCFTTALLTGEIYPSALSLIFFLMIIFLYACFYYGNVFTSETPILANSVFLTWSYKMRNYYVIWICLNCFLAPFCDILAPWTTLLSCFLCFFLLCYICYRIYFFPYVKYNANIFFGGLISASVIYPFFVWTRFFYNDFSITLFLLIELFVMIIYTCIFALLMRKAKNRIVKILTLPEGVPPTDKAKLEYLDNVIIFSSIHDVKRYLNIGLMFHCPLFIDQSFLKYLLINYADPAIVIKICQFVSFFPYQNQFFAYILGLIAENKKMDLGQKFLVYQMKRTHQYRQSYISNDAKAEYQRLVRASNNSISMIRGFWQEIVSSGMKISIESFREVAEITNQTIAMFYDSIEKFPNNVDINDEFCRFLIDGAGNFSQAIDQNKKSISKGSGSSEVDMAFRSFVNIYPKYLIDKILDKNGNLIYEGAFRSFSPESSFALAKCKSETASIEELDFNLKNDEIMKKLFTEPRQRMMLQYGVKNTRFHGFNKVVYATIIQLVVALLSFLLSMYLVPRFSYSIFPYIRDENYILEGAATIQTMAVYAGIEMVSQYMQNGYIKNIDLSFKQNNTFLVMHQQAIKNKNLYNQYISSVVPNSNSRYQEVESLFDFMINFSFPIVIEYVEISLKQSITAFNIIVEEIATFATLAKEKRDKDQFLLRYLPSVIDNCRTLTLGLHHLSDQIFENGLVSVTKNYQMLIAGGFAISAFFFLVFNFLQLRALATLQKSINSALSIISNVKKEDVAESFKPIAIESKKTDLRGNSVLTVHHHNLVKHLLVIFSLLFNLFVSLIFIMDSIMLYKNLNSYSLLLDWINHSGRRFIKIIETAVMNLQIGVGSLFPLESQQFMNESLRMSMESHAFIQLKVTGLNQRIDVNQFQDRCPNQKTDSYSSYVDCISLNLALDLAEYYLLMMCELFDSVWNPNFSNMMYLIEERLIDSLYVFQADFISYALSIFNENANSIRHLFAYAIGGSLILFLITLFLILRLRSGLQGIKQMILFLPPQSIFQNTDMTDFILNNVESKNDVSMTPSEVVLASSPYAVIVISFNEVIQSINESLTKLSGFISDQILGQHINWLFPVPEEDCDKNDVFKQFYECLDAVKQDKSKTIEINTKIITENNDFLNVKASILCSKDAGNGIESIVIVLKSSKERDSIKKEIMESKKLSENLLSKLIPPETMAEILSQNKVSTFSSTNATVVIIALNGMSDYVHSLPPQQLVADLNSIYDMIEEIAAHYPAVHLIKINDDSIVFCAGLFDFKDDINEQVNQSVTFCCRVNDELEEINDKLAISIQLRFGINTGGSLQGRLLNEYSPIFDIYGPIIEEANILQAYGEIGIIQITEAVTKFIDRKKFACEKSVVISTKGNQDIQAYSVNPLVELITTSAFIDDSIHTILPSRKDSQTSVEEPSVHIGSMSSGDNIYMIPDST